MGAGEWKTVFLILIVAAIIATFAGVSEGRRWSWGVALGCAVAALAVLGLAMK